MRLSAMDLLHKPVGKTLLRFSLPFMVSTLLQTFYSTTDTVIVGQYLGSAGLSAVSNGSQLMQMLYMICISFSNAGQVLIAQAEGAGDRDRTDQIVKALFVLELALSIAIGGLCILFGRNLLALLNTPDDAMEQAVWYTVICGAGMVFTGLYNMFSAIFRGMGDSVHPLLFVVIASAFNVVLDIVFITAFRWNVAGAALATVIGQAISVIFSVIFFQRIGGGLRLWPGSKEERIDKDIRSDIVRLGIPMAIQGGAIQSSFLFVSSMVNALGLSVSAAFGVAQKLRNLPNILTQGLRLGAASMIGQNWGAGERERVSETVRYSILAASAINLIFGVVFLSTPVLCFRAFTPDETVLAYAGMCMFTLVVELPARSLMPGCNALIDAQGFVQLSFVLAFVDAFGGRFFFCWLLGTVLNLGAFGFFLGYGIGTYLTAVPAFVYYISGLWKKRKVLVRQA